MVRLGRTYGNLMVDVVASNAKLRARARRAVELATDVSDDEIDAALAAADGDAKVAIVSLLDRVSDAANARRRLDAAGGAIRPGAGGRAMRLGVEAAVVDGVLLRGDVEIADGRIAAVGARTARSGSGIAIPGLVDLQVNGFGGVDFAAADAAGYRRAGEALLECGVTAFQPTLITAPEDELVAALAEVPRGADRAARDRRAPRGPVPLPRPARRAPRRSARRDPDAALLERLLAAGPVSEMTLAPELDGALELIDLLNARGVVVSCGHSDATAEEAARAFDRGAGDRHPPLQRDAAAPAPRPRHRRCGARPRRRRRPDDPRRPPPRRGDGAGRLARGRRPGRARLGRDRGRRRRRRRATGSATSTSRCATASRAATTACSPAAR